MAKVSEFTFSTHVLTVRCEHLYAALLEGRVEWVGVVGPTPRSNRTIVLP
jgi:hypothetical protein